MLANRIAMNAAIIMLAAGLIVWADDTAKQDKANRKKTRSELTSAKIHKRFNARFSLNENGIPVSIEGDLSRGITATDPIDKAYQFFELNKDIFSMENPRQELILRDVSIPKRGSITYIKFDQFVESVKVLYNAYTVEIDVNGTIIYAGGIYNPALREIDAVPVISKEQSIKIVIAQAKCQHEPWLDKIEEETRLLIANLDGNYRLVWRAVFICRNLCGSQYAYIDAKTGEILKQGSDIRH
jgi:Zn-dependent metalloprotease